MHEENSVSGANSFASQPAYLPEKLVARRLGISVKWLQKMRYQGGGIPFFKFGGAIRYAIEDIQAFEAACKKMSSSDQPRALHTLPDLSVGNVDRYAGARDNQRRNSL